MRRVVSALPALAMIVALLGAWELYVDLGGVDSLVLPAPHAIFASLLNDRALLWSNFLVTAKEIVLGILVAMVGGLGMAILIHFSTMLRRALYPLLVASQAVPVPMLAPVLALWLGFGILPKLVVIALVSFFPIVVTTLAGFAAVDPDLIKLMRTFDASRLQTFRRVELPAALPSVFTGTKIAIVVAVIGAVFGEWLSSSAGLGYLFTQSIDQLLPARAFATTAVLCALSIGLFGLMTVAERRLLPWAHQPTGERN
jgi:ABC-type nitrate/sulfonate/bicarbonate transport system permease component